VGELFFADLEYWIDGEYGLIVTASYLWS
jgi:hypothetical protein